jgi:hypothetical protein
VALRAALRRNQFHHIIISYVRINWAQKTRSDFSCHNFLHVLSPKSFPLFFFLAMDGLGHMTTVRGDSSNLPSSSESRPFPSPSDLREWSWSGSCGGIYSARRADNAAIIPLLRFFFWRRGDERRVRGPVIIRLLLLVRYNKHRPCPCTRPTSESSLVYNTKTRRVTSQF